MQALSRDDFKFLLSGVLGALLLAVVVFAAYEGWQRTHRAVAPPSQSTELTQEQKANLTQEGTATGSSTLTKTQEQTLIKTGTSAGPSTLTAEERQRLIEAGSAH